MIPLDIFYFSVDQPHAHLLFEFVSNVDWNLANLLLGIARHLLRSRFFCMAKIFVEFGIHHRLNSCERFRNGNTKMCQKLVQKTVKVVI